MRIVLLNPPSKLLQRGEHLGLGYLAAVLRHAGHQVEILDAFLCEQNLCEALSLLNERAFDLLGVTVNAANLSEALTISRIVALGNENCHVVFGGVHASLCYETLLQKVPWLNWVVLGEGERTVVELVNCLEAGRDWRQVPGLAYRQGNHVSMTAPRELIANLDQLPFPARDLLETVKKRGASCYISASRGCPWNCSFCAIQTAYRFTRGARWRARSVQNTIDEIETLHRNSGVADFYFVDDNFLGHGERGRARARELAREILQRRLDCKLRFSCRAKDVDRELFGLLKKAGLVEVFIGVESGVERALKTLSKGSSVQDNVRALSILTDLRIKCDVGLILIDPFTTVEEVRENLGFLKPLDGAFVSLHNITASLEVYQGTPVQKALTSRGLVHSSSWAWQYQVVDSQVETLRRLANQRRSSPLKLLTSIWHMKEHAPEGSLLQIELDGLLREIKGVEIDYAERLLEFACGDSQSPISVEDETRSNLHRISEKLKTIILKYGLESQPLIGEQ